VSLKDDIHEQPGVLARLLQSQAETSREIARSLAHTPLKLPPGLPEWLTPLSSIVAAQLFCYHVTRAKGLDTESPRGLRKVTLTH
jgi:glucosamine 6-phosphate synthetase-like amidotransferase/phosphosugar isomerase protein